MANNGTTPAGPVEPLRRGYRGASSINEYTMEEKLGEGTFGEVYRGRSKRTNQVFAMKKILMHNEKDGFPITALREIKLLKMLVHENVIRLEEMAVERPKNEPGDKTRKKAVLYMVFPYMHHDLSGLLDNPDVHLSEAHIKCYIQQLLRGLKYLHNSHILHRDMKAANLLINNRGILQIADFGLARHYDGQVPQAGQGNGEATRDYTCLVVTRWYRPPELLLQLRKYTPAIDMWGAGCVFGEMFRRKPILTGKSDLHQAELIWDLIGTPNEQNMPGCTTLPGGEGLRNVQQRQGNIAKTFRELSPEGLSLLTDLLKLDWRTRINAIDALNHPYFKTRPLPSRPEEIPRFSDSHELDRRQARGTQQVLPPAPAGGTVGGGANGEWVNGQMNGKGWNRDDRDRGPPRAGGPPGTGGDYPPRTGGPPPQQRDIRGGPPPPPPQNMRHPLPPRPVEIDTYIPSYRDAPPDRRDDRRSREPDRDRGGGPPGSGMPPSRRPGPPPPMRDPYDHGGYNNRDRDRDYMDRDRDRDGRMRDHRRTRSPRSRSRSPVRRNYRDDRDGRDNRDRDRDRDYRR